MNSFNALITSKVDCDCKNEQLPIIPRVLYKRNQFSQIYSPFDKNYFPSERQKHVEAKKFDEIKIKDIESKHKIS